MLAPFSGCVRYVAVRCELRGIGVRRVNNGCTAYCAHQARSRNVIDDDNDEISEHPLTLDISIFVKIRIDIIARAACPPPQIPSQSACRGHIFHTRQPSTLGARRKCHTFRPTHWNSKEKQNTNFLQRQHRTHAYRITSKNLLFDSIDGGSGGGGGGDDENSKSK